MAKTETWTVTLVVTTEYGDPARWDWDDLVGEPASVTTSKRV